MKWFYNLKVSSKLIAGFIIVALIAGSMGTFGIINLKNLDNSDTELYENMAVPLSQMANIGISFQRVRINLRDIVDAENIADINNLEQTITDLLKVIDTESAEFEKRILSQEVRDEYTNFVQKKENYGQIISKVIVLAKEGKDEEATALLNGEGKNAAFAENAAIDKLIEMKVSGASQKSEDNTKQADKAMMVMLILVIAVMVLSIIIGYFISRIISRPIKQAFAMIKEMSMGHLGMRLKMSTKDEIGQMATAMDSFADDLQNVVIGTMKKISAGDVSANIEIRDDKDEIAPALKNTIETIRELINETGILIAATQEGKLDTRGNADKYSGSWKELVIGINGLIDAFVAPINVTAEYIERISKGDIPAKISDTYLGDFNEIKNNLNTCIDAVNALVADANMLAKAAVEGKLDTRADASKHGGDFGKIVDGVNKTLDAVIGPLNVAAEYVDRISKGDIPSKITDSYNGDFNEIKNNLNTCIDAVNALVADANMLAKAAVEGKLDTRADASKHGGDFGKIVDGVNKTLDAVIGPLNVAAEYVDRISKGDIPSKITDSYNGDFNEIKNNLNTCIDAVNALVADANMLAKAAVEGKLDTRADASMHGGDFGKIVDGVNKTLDAVIGPLNVAAKYVDRISKGDIPSKITDSYNGDFNEIKNNLNTCIDAVNALVADSNTLSQAAVDGKLNTRADASKHGGDFGKIVDGVNKTLDAVIKPVQEAANVLEEMSNGNLQLRVTGDYKGDHASIKNALNETIDSLSSYVNEISSVLTEMSNSNMVVEISGDYKGDFAPIKQALNLIIESFNQVLYDINNAADQVAAGSRQVSDGSQALSQGATEQASAIEQLTASITEIAVQTKQNAANANEANDLALAAKNNAAGGNAQMKEMLQAMEEINISSANISKIIKVIDEIAFQTNILALNAAVEAARAGQHGKGFAVVAEEVRNLAARSASAAKETTGLIEGSIKKVEAGTKIANETAMALDKIVNDVTKATDLVGTIAVASNEQATGIAQVNQGVEQVSMVVQSNSATAEESAAASEELSSQADLLKDMIGKFSLKNGDDKISKKLQIESSMKKVQDGTIKKQSVDKRNSKLHNEAYRNPKISLSDSEFGKY